MAVFTEPTKWAQTLGKDADVVKIPDIAGDTDPSIDKIFPSVFSIPLAQGGRAIPRSVLNGLFKLLGDWIYYIQNGGIASYSASLDYAVGSFVKYNNNFYRCIQANGASSTVKAPTDAKYWSKVTTLADVSNAFADISFSNVNDTADILMAHNAMPSNVYDKLTLGATGTEYTAPADGYVKIYKKTSAVNQYLTLQDITNNLAMTGLNSTSAQGIQVFIPIKKGNKFTVNYTAGGSETLFIFIYAVGSESEQ